MAGVFKGRTFFTVSIGVFKEDFGNATLVHISLG
jgi:hypothetical protein